MSRPAASPGAVPRVLQLVLLLGGLFVLGLLWGERADAAERVGDDVPPPAASRDVAPRETSSVLPSAVPPVRGLVRSVTEDVTRTVGETVSGALTEVREQLPPAPVPPVASPAPTPPGMPDWPGAEVPGLPDPPAAEPPVLPDLPDLPDLPQVPDLPDLTDVSGLPVPPAPEEAAETASAHEPAAEKPGLHRDHTGRTADGRTGAYGPWDEPRGAQSLPAAVRTGADDTAPAAMEADAVQPDARVGYGPARQGPADHPAGVPGNRSSGDNNGPRCADAHAVSVEYDRVQVRLVPGVAVRAEVDETRDRDGDVPVSPA
ncbi:hypothetical protein [Streptomyces sp. NPDC052302]|uniref:hypothetical protein n=1 Tax=unclassified Streptomyces TaxID=2593676 RepID=UPI0037CE7074